MSTDYDLSMEKLFVLHVDYVQHPLFKRNATNFYRDFSPDGKTILFLFANLLLWVWDRFIIGSRKLESFTPCPIINLVTIFPWKMRRTQPMMSPVIFNSLDDITHVVIRLYPRRYDKTYHSGDRIRGGERSKFRAKGN